MAFLRAFWSEARSPCFPRCSEGGSGLATTCFHAIRYAIGLDKDKAMDDKTIHPQMRARYFLHACPQLRPALDLRLDFYLKEAILLHDSCGGGYVYFFSVAGVAVGARALIG